MVAPVVLSHDRWSSLSLSLIASHRRQIGDMAEALRLDAEALRLAPDAEARADSLTGLAADAVAVADAEVARQRLDDAAADAPVDWRTLTRWHWVAAELELIAGDQMRAVDHARSALATCEGTSARHEAKSRIILAAAGEAITDLPAVSRMLRAAGWVTLEWPLALVAADRAAGLPGDWLEGAWQAGCRATYAIERGLPKELVPVWRDHPGVRRLRAEGALTRDG